jgi:hypothetical protein
MADTTEEQKKAILPFLQVRARAGRPRRAAPIPAPASRNRFFSRTLHQRAEEIERVEPRVAYYCRMYAVEQGLALPSRSPQIDGLLGALLSKLEKDKAAINPGGDDAGHCEKFALTLFARADKADRAGRADKTTAAAYYAASIFFEVGAGRGVGWRRGGRVEHGPVAQSPLNFSSLSQIINQFAPLAGDIADMQRYAAWKAADIRKALREGRAPTPGPPPAPPPVTSMLTGFCSRVLARASTAGDAVAEKSAHRALRGRDAARVATSAA